MSKTREPNQPIWKDPYVKFIILFIGIYLLLYYFNVFYIGITSKGGFYVPFLAEHLNYIDWWRKFTLHSTATVLRWFDYTVYTNEFQLKVIGKGGIRLVYSCLGYAVMSAFIAFAVTFPAKIRHRYTFLFLGILIIQVVNSFRIGLLALYWRRKPPFLTMDHHDLFNIAVYTILILYAYIWLKYNTNLEQKQFDKS